MSDRRPDPFTDFDPDDNAPLYRLAGQQGGRKLFPVLNLTLNLTRGGAAAWSERMAMAFTATPLACGAPLLPRYCEDASRRPRRRLLGHAVLRGPGESRRPRHLERT